MTDNLKKMQKKTGWAFVAAVLMVAGTAFGQGASAAGNEKQADSFTWSAELVSLDPASRMITVKSRIENYADIKGLDQLMKGDAVTLTWTGMTWGAGIRDITRGHDTSAPADALVLPAEFVGTELKDQYVIYRLPIPADSVSKVQALKPGDWVTATSPRDASDPAKAVVDIHGFNDVS